MADTKIHLISYASGPFLPREPAFRAEARAFGSFSEVKVFHYTDLSSEFRAEYRELLSHTGGGGYWIWKPRIIRDYLASVPDGDIVFYIDVGCSIVNTDAAKRRLAELVRLTQQHKMLRYQLARYEYQSTNRATIDYFANRFNKSADALADTHILAGGLIGMVRCAETVRWTDEYLSILADKPALFTNEYNSVSKDARFIGHHHDQSVSSLLSKCYLPQPAVVPISSMGRVSRPLQHPFLATRLRRADPNVMLKRSFKLTALIWPLLTVRMRIKIWRNLFR